MKSNVKKFFCLFLLATGNLMGMKKNSEKPQQSIAPTEKIPSSGTHVDKEKPIFQIEKSLHGYDNY